MTALAAQWNQITANVKTGTEQYTAMTKAMEVANAAIANIGDWNEAQGVWFMTALAFFKGE